jgi:hypothetical protein
VKPTLPLTLGIQRRLTKSAIQSTTCPVGVDEVAEQFGFDSRCPKCNLLAHQQAEADTLKTDLESDEFRLYCIRCDYYSKPSPTGKLNILKNLP